MKNEEVMIFLLVLILCSSVLTSCLANLDNLQSVDDKVSSFIVGGRKASEGQFPYLVSLRTSWNMHLCGGAILSSRWVLTAGHCLWFLEIPEIVAGSTRVSEGGERYAIERVVLHPNLNFDEDPFRDDICLLRTNRSIIFNQLVQPIPYNRDRIRFRSPGVIAGWGWTEGGNHLNPDNFFPEVSENLNYIEVHVLSHFECTLRLSGWAFYLRTDHICTYTRGGGACTFDSGSPVVVDGEVVGIVSFVIPCALNFPDWGPRISSYRRWIDSHVHGSL